MKTWENTSVEFTEALALSIAKERISRMLSRGVNRAALINTIEGGGSGPSWHIQAKKISIHPFIHTSHTSPECFVFDIQAILAAIDFDSRQMDLFQLPEMV